jgi:hypothetical protein
MMTSLTSIKWRKSRSVRNNTKTKSNPSFQAS